jgi:hypothetical protein
MSSDENMGYGGRSIHVPASGPVADAPRPNAAEPAVDAVPDDGGVAKVEAELASKAGVTNEYVSPETTADAEATDNAEVSPEDAEKPADDGKRDKTRGDKTKDIV